MLENSHPLVVHFPIALLLTSVAFYWAGLFWKGRGFDKVAWYTLLLGLVGTAVTILSGLIAAKNVPLDSPAMQTLTTHKVLGIATFVIFGMQAVCAWRSQGIYSPGKRILHTVIQLIGVSLIIAVGYFGGELVYTFGIGVLSP
ncbi:MAG: DUF2231 domain-containing protein [Chloroflexi bacterium]|nr:DUF2231 domain-containing protein [Chloroflexota bacterium]